MVYCGKASQGCQHCRTRRIKCDRVRPQCSQCVRVGKNCPGYRDQLSLMFRDDTTKVIQKAHAQWGPSFGSSDSSGTSSASSGSAGSPVSFVNGDGSPIPDTPISRRSSSVQRALVAAPRIPQSVQPTVFEKGFQFYIDHHMIGYPQEPKTPVELQNAQWISHPAIADMMTAIGLSSMSNLTNDEEMDLAARQKYGVVLRNTAQSMQNPAGLDLGMVLRSVVLFAVFEVVQGKSETAGSLRAHIMGAAALLSSSLVPRTAPPAGAFRGIVQLCFSMLTPCYMAGVSLPGTALEWIELSKQSLTPEDLPSAELLLTISRFLQLSANLKRQPLTKSRPVTKKLVSQLMLIDTKLAAWEMQRQKPGSKWVFTTEEAVFPPEAAFRNCFQVYPGGMWAARVWNHYRWARILANQTILELLDANGTNDPSMGLGFRRGRLETIRRVADDLFASIPTHFRHPRLTRAHRDLLDQTCILPPGAGGGIGSAGIPGTMLQLKVAASAPGIPTEYGDWALGVLDTVWAETGMLQARTLAGGLRGYLEKRDVVKIEMVEVKEESTP